ncbi:MAG: ribonuclease P protein component [Acidobacteriaceae bacterium]
MPSQTAIPTRKQTGARSRETWLRKHADYQRVYREGKRQSLPLMTYFFATRDSSLSDPSHKREGSGARRNPLSIADSQSGARIGLTAGRVLGNAVERNRIKRRMRAAVRLHRTELSVSADVILHPRRTVLEADFTQIERDVRHAFRAIQAAMETKSRDEHSPHAR